jgi:hypothetical protein
MARFRVTTFGCSVLLLAVAPWLDELGARRHAAEAMATAGRAFLDSLKPEQQSKARFALQDEERRNWYFVPRERRGLPLADLGPDQRDKAMALLRTGLSEHGYVKATTIIQLELVLRELGENPAVRNPDLYYFSVFGEPSAREPWGWRVEGHHLSLNFTVAGATLVADAPAFFGANPAEVREGSRRGLRVLGREEDLGRELFLALDEPQRQKALIADVAPAEIVTGNAPRVDPLAPAGVEASDLTGPQVAVLRQLLEEYLSRQDEEIAAIERDRIERAGFGRLRFAWAGKIEPGQPHYYRVQGPTVLIEYDNTQNHANHAHSVWRSFDRDFGEDLLREHYKRAPSGHGHDHP